ncbi:potassium channel protein [Natranaerobius thermophilus]|uniref:Ion transport 2 domain protein n=1 Tax=Natranaerobius thermophilus (strain ATCC BAA-1301 / DSM 18059 / JW/NM-WN-LF) TaxID=457570 RepID=B2A8B9_NATTJ|nr:potassium channel family protein [Natranaerobius thermophilus]ACB84485.1 Ion transport 2 domain protein [Natranaerobius thermophilus JW/NM-WN-LF]
MPLYLVKNVLNQILQIKNFKLVTLAILFLVLSSYVLYFIEPDTFSTPFAGFWFVMTTISQQGYADILPNTLAGRIYTIILFIIGIGIFGVIIAKWVDGVIQYRQAKESGNLSYLGKNHIVMINWSKKTENAIDELLKNQNKKIVLIDELQTTPIQHEQVHYIQGAPTDKNTLTKANILQSKAISVFAKDNITDEISLDGKTLLIGLTIQELLNENKKDIYTSVEVINEQHLSSFKNLSKIDKIILSNKPFSNILTQSILENASP